MKQACGWRKVVAGVGVAAVALLAGGEAWAQANFNKASDVWTNAANWTPNGVPGPQTNCCIGSATRTIATATINDGGIGFCQNLYLGYVTGGYGELIITNNGVLTFGSTIFPCWNTTGTGVLTVAGGTLRGVTIDDVKGDSTINLRGGLIHLTNTASRLCLGNSDGSGFGETKTAKMNISGGTLFVEKTTANVNVGHYHPGSLIMTGGGSPTTARCTWLPAARPPGR